MSSALVGTFIAALVAIVGPLLVYRVNKRTATTDAAQRQIDQIQEDRQADRDQFEKATARMDERQGRSEKRIEQLESLGRISSDYILSLRYHIAEGKPPPPPPFPAELTRGMPHDH